MLLLLPTRSPSLHNQKSVGKNRVGTASIKHRPQSTETSLEKLRADVANKEIFPTTEYKMFWIELGMAPEEMKEIILTTKTKFSSTWYIL
jgi:hypothetical protein